MKYITYFTLLFLVSQSCQVDSVDKTVENFFYQVKTHEYAPCNIPSFFEQLANNHIVDYEQFAQQEYHDICVLHNIDAHNKENKQKYYTIKILHDLFTSQSAQNCAIGQAWNIPYYWHWIENNPRHKIYLKESGKLLKDIKPNKEFGNYHSKADIDRTPYLFLSDLFSEGPQYTSKDCGEFSTFGWCSEREMAFVSLMTLLGHKGKVAAQGGHSWTELIMTMNLSNGKKGYFKVNVDNTFDKIGWNLISESEIKKWETELGDSKTKRWYNEKAVSSKEQNRISNFQISPTVMHKLEREFVSFLNRRI